MPARELGRHGRANRTPIPGTGFYDEMMAQGLVEEHDWSRYDLAHPVLRSQHFTRQRLLDLPDECYRKFYGRPIKIIKYGILGDPFARYTYRFTRFVSAGARSRKAGSNDQV